MRSRHSGIPPPPATIYRRNNHPLPTTAQKFVAEIRTRNIIIWIPNHIICIHIIIVRVCHVCACVCESVCRCVYYTNARVIVEITRVQHTTYSSSPPPPPPTLQTSNKINNSGGLTSGAETALQRNAYLWGAAVDRRGTRSSFARKSGEKKIKIKNSSTANREEGCGNTGNGLKFRRVRDSY